MKQLLLVGLFLTSSMCLAGTKGYDLKFEVSSNGKLVSSPHIITLAGEQSSITQDSGNESTFINVIATEGQVKGTKGILLRLEVGTIAADGSRKILSTPKILATENEVSTIELNSGTGPTTSMTVVATRTTI